MAKIHIDDIILLDGAVGTELEKRGFRTKLPLWSASAIEEAPQLLQTIHEEYLESGAQIVTANTFRTSIYTYEKSNLSVQKVETDIQKAHHIARQAQSKYTEPSQIAASITSLEDCYRPDLTPAVEVLNEYHYRQIEILRKTGFDLLLVETMHTLREALVIASICDDLKLPFMMSFITGQHGHLLGGDFLVDAIDRISKFHPMAILLNCRPFGNLNHHLPHLCSFNGPIGLYPNGAGIPDNEYGWKFLDSDPAYHFQEYGISWIKTGVRIVGGCCGTTPTDIKSLAQYLGRR